MEIPDLINAAFEAFGGVTSWINFIALKRDREIKGIHWGTQAFFATWGLWNLFYYPHLGQWVSFWAGVFLVTGNLAWTFLALRVLKTQGRT